MRGSDRTLVDAVKLAASCKLLLILYIFCSAMFGIVRRRPVENSLGDWGSEVQILSLRPLIQLISEIDSSQITELARI